MRRKTLSKAAAFALAGALAFTAVPVSTQAAAKANGIAITKESVAIVAGKSMNLKANVTPKKASQTVTWKTSNSKYLTVSKSGKITAKKAGIGKTVKVYAITSDGTKIKSTATVKITEATNTLKVASKKLTVTVGKKANIKATVSPSKASKVLTYTSSNKKVATVTSTGKVTGVKAGKATITVKTTDGSKLTQKVTVTVNAKEVNKTITASDLQDGKYTLDGTYDNVSVDSSVGAAEITLTGKIQNTLYLGDGAAYTVIADGATINNVAAMKNADIKTSAVKGIYTFIVKKGSAISNITIAVSFNLVQQDGGSITKVTVAPKEGSAKVEVSLDGVKSNLDVKGTAPVAIEANACTIANANVTGNVAVKDGAVKSTIAALTVTGENSALELGVSAKAVTIDKSAAKTTINVAAGATVDTMTVAAEGTKVGGSGTVTNVKANADGVAVDTKGTKVEAGEGVKDVTAGGSTVKPGDSVQTPSGGGGGGSSTTNPPVADKWQAVPFENGVYKIPNSAQAIRVSRNNSTSTSDTVEIQLSNLPPEDKMKAAWNAIGTGSEFDLTNYQNWLGKIITKIKCTGVSGNTKKFDVAIAANNSYNLASGEYSVTANDAKNKFEIQRTGKNDKAVFERTSDGVNISYTGGTSTITKMEFIGK